MANIAKRTRAKYSSYSFTLSTDRTLDKCKDYLVFWKLLSLRMANEGQPLIGSGTISEICCAEIQLVCSAKHENQQPVMSCLQGRSRHKLKVR